MYNGEQLAKLDKSVARRIRVEQKIVRKLIDIVLAKGYNISVNDGEEWVLKQSRDKTTICNAMMTTDEDVWQVRTTSGDLAGKVWFVYGNDGYDVVADYTAIPAMEEIMAELKIYVGKLEAGA